MPRVEKNGPRSAKRGVLDAGVALVLLDRRHERHGEVRELFRRSARGDLLLFISTVNLAEVLQHSRRYSEETGLDLVFLLTGNRVRFHFPDVETARKAAAFASLEDASLADRFAAATAEVLDAKLFTTDRTLGDTLKKRKIPVAVY